MDSLLNLKLWNKMFVSVALTIQMGHGVRDKLTDYWATVDQLYTPFYDTLMKRDWYRLIPSYLHFTDNRNEPDRMDINFDSRTMALGLTQPLTEMSTRNISWGVKAAGAYGWQPYHLHVPIVLKSGSHNLLEPSGPVQTCNGITLPFCLYGRYETCLKF